MLDDVRNYIVKHGRVELAKNSILTLNKALNIAKSIDKIYAKTSDAAVNLKGVQKHVYLSVDFSDMIQDGSLTLRDLLDEGPASEYVLSFVPEVDQIFPVLADEYHKKLCKNYFAYMLAYKYGAAWPFAMVHDSIMYMRLDALQCKNKELDSIAERVSNEDFPIEIRENEHGVCAVIGSNQSFYTKIIDNPTQVTAEELNDDPDTLTYMYYHFGKEKVRDRIVAHLKVSSTEELEEPHSRTQS